MDKTAADFDYSTAEIDTSAGKNGYSERVPGFVFYRGEPKHMRKARLDRFLSDMVSRNQRKTDERAGVSWLDRANRSYLTGRFGRSGVGKVLYWVPSPVNPVSLSFLTNDNGAAVDGLNRVVHNLSGTERGIGNLGLNIISLLDRVNPASIAYRMAKGRSLSLRAQDESARKFHADIARRMNGWFDSIDSQLDSRLVNKEVPKMSIGGVNLQDAAEGLTEFGTKGALFGALGRMMPGSSGASGMTNYFNGMMVSRDAPRVFHNSLDDLGAGRYRSAAENALWGIAYSSPLSRVGELLKARQAALAIKSPRLAKALGAVLTPIRHPFISGMSVTGPSKAMEMLMGSRPNNAASGSVGRSSSWVPWTVGAGLLAGIGGVGLYSLLNNRRRRKEREADESADSR